MRRAVHRSSRTVVVLRNETLRNFVEWRFENSPEFSDIRPGLQRKVLLASKTELNLGLAIEGSQRQHYSRLVMVEPGADDFLHSLTSDWLPEKAQLLVSVSGAEQIRRRADALLSIPGILPAAPALEKVREEMVRVLDGHVTRIPDLEAEPGLPRVAAVDLRTGGHNAGKRRTIRSEAGIVIMAYDRTEFASYDPDALQPFSRKLAKDLVKGDQIFAIDPEFISTARDRLNLVAHAADMLPQYHRLVADAAKELRGGSFTEKATHLRAAMLRLTPDADLPGDQALRSWIDVQDLIEAPSAQVRPNAPRTREQYLCFMQALGIAADLALLYWNYAIFHTRSIRIRSGAAFHQLFMGILIDPHSAIARLPPESSAEIWRLHEAAEGRIVTVAENTEDGK